MNRNLMSLSWRLPVILGALLPMFVGQVYADDIANDVVNEPFDTEPHIHGRIFVDGQTYNHSTIPLASTMDVTAARLSLSGWTTLEWRYLLQYDLATRSLKDAFIAYQTDKEFRVKVGQFQEPFSLEELTSSRFITFIERGLPNALVPGYHVGMGMERNSKHWSAALGAFTEPAGSKVSNSGGNAGWGVTGRWTVSPINRDRELVHFGLAGTYRAPATGSTLRIRETPETGFSSVRYVNTGTLSDVDHHASAGAELAGVAGPLSLQGEYIETQISRYSGTETLTFRGSYGFVSWFVTGESRPYKRGGTFGRIQPRRKSGALELAARYSLLDLNSSTVSAGKEEDTTLGLNWYLDSHTRLMADYVKVLARISTGTETPNIFLVRFQLDF